MSYSLLATADRFFDIMIGDNKPCKRQPKSWAAAAAAATNLWREEDLPSEQQV